jgi:hypothetical protein
MRDWISFAAVATLVVTAAGLVFSYLTLRRPSHRRSLLALGFATFVLVVLCAVIFLRRSGQETQPPSEWIYQKPPPSPQAPAARGQARRNDTRFFHSQTIDGATWVADGIPIAPAVPPTPSMTVLTLTEGSHDVIAKANGKVCRAHVNVPVPSGEQPVTLTCPPME